MIRCVRLWSGEDQNSYFEEGWLEFQPGPHGDLAEDTVGSGHSWKLLDEAPWRRLYVVLERDASLPFHAGAIPGL
jgi:hypothetical protein